MSTVHSKTRHRSYRHRRAICSPSPIPTPGRSVSSIECSNPSSYETVRLPRHQSSSSSSRRLKPCRSHLGWFKVSRRKSARGRHRQRTPSLPAPSRDPIVWPRPAVLLVCDYLLPFNDVKPAYTIALRLQATIRPPHPLPLSNQAGRNCKVRRGERGWAFG
jgi:hypothetical protein